jgi:hypothetical protein
MNHLRKMLESGVDSSRKQRTADSLRAQLSSWLVRHPSAPSYFIDLSRGSSMQLWQKEWLPRTHRSQLCLMRADGAFLASRALIELSPSPGTYRLAAAVATITGRHEQALEIAHRGARVLTEEPQRVTLAISRAFSSLQLGMHREALDAYRLVGKAGDQGERCNALFSGALLAAEVGCSSKADWWLDRLAEEDPVVSRHWSQAITLTRSRREGVDRTSRLLQTLGEPFEALLGNEVRC